MFGGGMTIENAGLDDFGFASKSRLSIQRAYHFGSTVLGSYVFGSSGIAIDHPKSRRVCKLKVGATAVRPITCLHPIIVAITFPSHMSDSRAIGVFDSGIGGLTVAKALCDLLPNEKIFYLGDTARVPYGGKSASTVERYSSEMTQMLIDQGVKLIVIACNSASAVALPTLENTLPVPVIGVIKPGAQAAIVDSARNCALATRELLDRQSLRAPVGNDGALEVALTDPPDIFLRVAREALQLQIGEVQLREVLHPARVS